MLRTILTFGVIAGAVVIAPMIVMMLFVQESGGHTANPVFGYLIMLLAFSLIFVGIKRYRDTVRGGVIRFWPAFGLGLGITAIAGLIYVLGWEANLYATDYAFADDYTATVLEGMRAKGASAAEIARKSAEMQAFKAQYANPLIRLPYTFVEIFPVGLIVSVVSAALLRNSRFLPARPAVG